MIEKKLGSPQESNTNTKSYTKFVFLSFYEQYLTITVLLFVILSTKRKPFIPSRNYRSLKLSPYLPVLNSENQF